MCHISFIFSHFSSLICFISIIKWLHKYIPGSKRKHMQLHFNSFINQLCSYHYFLQTSPNVLSTCRYFLDKNYAIFLQWKPWGNFWQPLRNQTSSHTFCRNWNLQKSKGPRSGKYGGCWRIFHFNFFSFRSICSDILLYISYLL